MGHTKVSYSAYIVNQHGDKANLTKVPSGGLMFRFDNLMPKHYEDDINVLRKMCEKMPYRNITLTKRWEVNKVIEEDLFKIDGGNYE